MDIVFHTVECSMLWTDKYAPVNSMSVLGNSGCVGKLKGWLKEWKTVTDRQARLEARERKKQQKKDRETKRMFLNNQKYTVVL